MKGVVLGICPEVQLVDISHEVAPFAIAEAAYTLAQAWNCFPSGTIHLVVVDPGVGSGRRPVLVEAGEHIFVAPDNGVLTMVLDSYPAATVREISAADYFRHPVSRTFHGRDIFAPVAAYLASGAQASRFGETVKDWVRAEFSKPVRMESNRWLGVILKVDRFGNIVTNFDWESFRRVGEQSFDLRVGSQSVTNFHPSYYAAKPGELFVLAGSGGYLEVSIKNRSAGGLLEVASGTGIELRFP
jgi:S-adenosylmethionine hydrolase